MCKFQWKDHSRFVTKNIAHLYKHGLFVDCTVNVEGQSFSAHKIILAATSPYFERLLKAHPDERTFVLNEMNYQDFKSVLEFIYYGFIEISCGKEQSFFQVAQFLQLQIANKIDTQHEGENYSKDYMETVTNVEESNFNEAGSPPLVLGLCSGSSSNTLIIQPKKEESSQTRRSNVNVLQQLPAAEFVPSDDKVGERGEGVWQEKTENKDYTESVHCENMKKHPTKSHLTCCVISGGRDRTELNNRNIYPITKGWGEKHFEEKNILTSVKEIGRDSTVLEETTESIDEKEMSGATLMIESTQESVTSSSLLNHRKLQRSPSSVQTFSSSSSFKKRCIEVEEVAEEISGQKHVTDTQLLETRSNEEGVTCERRGETSADSVLLLCEKSGNKINNKRSLLIHDGKKGFVCKMCGKVFQRRDTLNVHKRIHSPSKSFLCNVCAKPFSRRSNLQTHIRIHSGEKPFLCKDCGKSFSQDCTLKAHIRIHSGDKPFLCEDCGKSFARRNNLQEHERIHSGAMPFGCKECGKSFSQHGSLQAHIRTHTGDKPYLCEDCGKSFSQSGSLQAHMRTHSGDKPFSCEDCGKSFSRRCNLQRHKRIHSGEKPFSCKECGKSFSQQGSLKIHFRIHSGE